MTDDIPSRDPERVTAWGKILLAIALAAAAAVLSIADADAAETLRLSGLVDFDMLAKVARSNEPSIQ
jgi:hypothetical protein